MPFTFDDRSTFHLALDEAASALAAGPHPERARRDAESLLLSVLRRNASERNLAWLIAHEDEPLTGDAVDAFRDSIARRLAGEPIQYIVGEAEFYGLPYHVNRDVLIPRPETELVVEKAIAVAQMLVAANPEPRIVDVGTGSGAIAVALARTLPRALVASTDISALALEVARANAARNGVAERVRFLQGDLLEPVAGEQFEFIVSNPPYVPGGDRASLDVEVREYEPAQALFAGADGLAIYHRLIPAAFCALVPGGHLLLEIGYGQQQAVQALLEKENFTGIEFTADLQGIARVVVACRP